MGFRRRLLTSTYTHVCDMLLHLWPAYFFLRFLNYCWTKNPPKIVNFPHIIFKESLFVWLRFLSHSRIFHSFGDATITGEGLQILTSYSWPLSSEGSFSVPHLLWHGASVYNGQFWWPVTFTPKANRLAVEISLPVLTN